MSFNAASMTFIGGQAGASVWAYQTADALSSNVAGTAFGGYFDYATKNTTQNEGIRREPYFPNLQKGDMIFAANGSTPVVTMLVVSIANANGVSLVPSGLSCNQSNADGW